MRNLTIKLKNNNDRDRNILIYQKGPDAGMRAVNLLWSRKSASKNNVTNISWGEQYCFCIGRKKGANRFNTVATDYANPGDVVTVRGDRAGDLMLADLRPTGSNDRFMMMTDVDIRRRITGYCIGLGIDSKLFHGVEQIMGGMNYQFTTLADYYILASDKFDEGDIVTGEIEQMAQKLEFPASGILDVQLSDENTWTVKAG